MTSKEIYGKLVYFCNNCEEAVQADKHGNIPPLCDLCWANLQEDERHAEESKHYAEQ